MHSFTNMPTNVQIYLISQTQHAYLFQSVFLRKSQRPWAELNSDIVK